MKKARKPRGFKLSGYRSMDMCDGCFSANCDSFVHIHSIYGKKKDQRLAEGKCVGCGKIKKECSCKSSLSIKP